MALFGMFDDKRKIIDNQIYWHYSLLSNWEKNNQARTITKENWLKLLASIKRKGLHGVLEIDAQGVVYDGNHRLKAIKELIEKENVLVSDSGQDLSFLAVKINNPLTESEKWELALIDNEQMASWNQDILPNFMPEFENNLDLSLINISFADPISMPETIEKGEGEKQTPAKPEVECPNCQTKFIPS